MTEESLDTLLAGLDAPAEQNEQTSDATEEAETVSDAAEETDGATEAKGEGEKPETDAEEQAEEDEETKPKKPSGSERLKRRNQALEARNAELEARLSQYAPASGAGGTEDIARAVEAEIGAPPKEEDFKGDYLAYERALTAYETEKRIVSREVKARAAQSQTLAQERMAERVEALHEAQDVARKAIPDFDKVVSAAEGVSVAPHVGEQILDSDKAALLQYHFAKNPKALDALNRASPLDVAKEIGRLEARLSLPKPQTATKAPAPIAPVKGSAAPRSEDAEINSFLSKTYGKGRR